MSPLTDWRYVPSWRARERRLRVAGWLCAGATCILLGLVLGFGLATIIANQ